MRIGERSRRREVRGTFDEVVAQGAGIGDAYLRAVVRVEQPTPGLAQRLRDVLPDCVSADNPSRYPERITAQGYLEERLREIKLK